MFYKVGSMRSEGDEPIVVAAPIVIAFRKEASGSLIMKIQDHFWPEDLEPAIPVIHDRAHSLLQHLLLLVELSNESENSGCEILQQILQPANLTSNRPFRVALLSRTTEQEDASKLSKRNPLSAGEIRVFKPSQRSKQSAGFSPLKYRVRARRPGLTPRPTIPCYLVSEPEIKSSVLRLASSSVN